ncbi:MAG: hypothetical protein KAS32_17625 [Candidatus Peribacteraceae bacterium]|nr:hypothetical protein [Candidatus Peribacteraceae bacterium]
MLLKLGVSINNLEYHCRRALNIIEAVYSQQGFSEAVVTSTCEGNHSPSSFHYQNRALDLRWPIKDKDKCTALIRAIRSALGPSFDVITEASHIHVEYDPK